MKHKTWIGIRPGEISAWDANYEDIDAVQAAQRGNVRVQERSILLRKEFSLAKPLKSAALRICGLGFYEVHINGQKPDEARVFAPVKSEYFKKALYDTYDVTALLAEQNALCVELGNGWFCGPEEWWEWRIPWYGTPRLALELKLTFADGTTELIASDESFALREGAVLFNCIYDGEIVDANEEPVGWLTPGYDDSAWQKAAVVEAPTENLIENTAPPIRIIRTLAPVQTQQLDALRTVYDFGENAAAIPSVTLQGRQGQKITLETAEFVDADGNLDKTSYDECVSTDVYILRGGETEVYRPKFTWHGYQFMQITRSDESIAVLDVKSHVVHSDVADSGHFSCSNQALNHVHETYLRTQKACLQGLPVDCPQKNERMPWLGDAVATAESAIYSLDMRKLYQNLLEDIRLGQHSMEDWYQFISPWVRFQPRDGIFSEHTPDWSCALPVIADLCLRHYDDRSFITDNYDSLARYIRYLVNKTEHNFLFTSFGDWMSADDPDNTGVQPYVGMIFFHKELKIIEGFANILGKTDDAAYYVRKADKIKQALLAKYYDAETGVFGDGRQFSLAAPLWAEVLTGEDAKKTIQALKKAIGAADGHPRGGIFGAAWAPLVLMQYSEPAAAYTLLAKEGYPGFIDLAGHGRTTFPEKWDGTVSGGSGCHAMFGGADVLFYRLLGGITIDYTAEIPVKIKPYFPPDLNYVNCSLNINQGAVRCNWKRTAQGVSVHIEIPEGVKAAFYGWGGEERALAAGAFDLFV